MPRENATAKALRVLVRLASTFRLADNRRILAWCRGDSAEVYDVGYDRGGWFCSCPALGRCSHLIALMRVTVRPRGEDGDTR
jgi:hypothetical protein